MKDENLKKKSRPNDSKRLVLSDLAQTNANKWITQVNEEFKGMLSLKRNEIINFLLEEMGESLSTNLLEKIRSQKLTDSHIAKWIYEQTLEAQKKGIEPNFDELVKIAQGSIKRAKKTRKTKNKTSQTIIKKASNLNTLNTEKPSI